MSNATITCENCGAEAPARGRVKRFCSRRCKWNAGRRRRYTDPEYRAHERERGRRQWYRTDPVVIERREIRRRLRHYLQQLEEHA